MSEYLSGYLQECVGGYLVGLLNLFLQDPAMPSQEPPSDAKDEEVDLPPDDTEETDGSKTPLSTFSNKRIKFYYWIQYLQHIMYDLNMSMKVNSLEV